MLIHNMKVEPVKEFADILAVGVIMLPLMIWSYWSYINDPETKKEATKEKAKQLLDQYQKEHPVDTNERRKVLSDVSSIFIKNYPKEWEPKSLNMYPGEWVDKKQWYEGSSNVIDFGFTMSASQHLPGYDDANSESKRREIAGKYHAALRKCINDTMSDLSKKYGKRYHVYSLELDNKFYDYLNEGDGDEGALILVDIQRAKACAKWISEKLKSSKR